DFHLDKETENMFQRFQNGVNLVKSDEKIFKGLFFIAIKDVDLADVEELKDEFPIKLLQIQSVVRERQLSMSRASRVLVNFDTQEEIHDAPIELGDLLIEVQDSGLELAPTEESISNDKVLSDLRSRIGTIFKRNGVNGDQWHSVFQSFLGALIERR
ncbi:hypothetical protein KI387_006826, partial [Taxus chinensis]